MAYSNKKCQISVSKGYNFIYFLITANFTTLLQLLVLSLLPPNIKQLNTESVFLPCPQKTTLQWLIGGAESTADGPGH